MMALKNIFTRVKNKVSLKPEYTEITRFYTNTEFFLETFDQMIHGKTSKNLLVIHGLGGVGKSTLLKMYLLNCRRNQTPIAMIASEEASSPVDILEKWVEDFSFDNITFPTFQKAINHYHDLQKKVENEAKKPTHNAPNVTKEVGKAVASTVVNLALNTIPIVGPFAGALGSKGTESFIDWLNGFLSQPELTFYLDPMKRLENDFLADINKIAIKQRIVLVLDTYEQITAQDDWLRELVHRLPKQVIMVIAGRTIPRWERSWQGWMGKAEILELKEMKDENLRLLIHRYYSYIHTGEPDPKQIEDIVQFARGLPIVATTVVQLWVRYGTEDFYVVRPQVIADLVDRLFEGIPQEMRPAFEAAAVLRFFNIDSLEALLENNHIASIYTEFRRWPFIRSSRDGLAVHDTVREMINEALLIQSPKRLHQLHQLAIAYYESILETSSGNDKERILLELLYHHICFDEKKGIQLFQILAEEFASSRMANRLLALLDDVNIHHLTQENSLLWRKYYNARLAHIQAKRDEAEAEYLLIGEDIHAEPKLRAYALCDWGSFVFWPDRLNAPGMEEKVIKALELSLRLVDEIDTKLAWSWIYLSRVYVTKGEYQKGLYLLENPRKFFAEKNDFNGQLMILEREAGIYWREGEIRKYFELAQKISTLYLKAGKPTYMTIRHPPTWEWVWLGRLAEHEHEYREALRVAQLVQDREYISRRTRDLSLILAAQGKNSEALQKSEEALAFSQTFNDKSSREVFEALISAGFVNLQCKNFKKAEEYLTKVISLGQTVGAEIDIAAFYLAIVYEIQRNIQQSLYFYGLALKEATRLGHNFTKCGAITGLVRLKCMQKEYDKLATLWDEGEKVALQYEYHHYLASLYLSRGHVVWDASIDAWDSGFDSTLQCYQYALIHSLSYNRFLLDEILSGKELVSPYISLIPFCLEQKTNGEQMLMSIQNWWENATYTSGKVVSSTIPLFDNIPLLEAEKHIRKREPGDGSSQISLVEQIQIALANKSGNI